MRIALVEPTLGGHHELHLKTAAVALATAGHDVVLLYPQPDLLRTEILSGHPELSDRITGAELRPLPETNLTRRFHLTYPAKWKAVANTVRGLEMGGKPFDLVFFMFLDEYLGSAIPVSWLDSAFKYNWAGIYMQPLYRVRETKKVNRPHFLRRDHLLRSKWFKGAMALDESSIPWLKEQFAKPFVAMAEYGNMATPDLDAPIVKELTAFASGRPVIGVFGALAKRKGVLTLLRAASHLKDLDFVIAIAGQLATETFSSEELVELEKLTQELGSKCFYRPQKIETDAAFSALISISAVGYIAYENWVFSSGLQSIAAEFDVPTVVANTGVMAERADKFKTGVTIDPTSQSQAADAVRKLLSSELPKEGFAAYRSQHQIEAFRTELCSLAAHAGARD